MKRTITRTAVALLLAAGAASSWASVIIHGTRVIFPSSEKEVSVRLSNEGQSPGLIQMWMDAGNPDAKPDETKVPFILTPPLFRIEPGKGQTLRMIYTREPLPQDRESVFYLNLLEVPPRPVDLDAENVNFMQMAFRTRIKVFYRPKALDNQEAYYKVPSQMTWTVVREDAGYALEVKNPSPYYYNLINAGLAASVEGGKDIMNSEGGMVEPGGTQRYPLKDLKSMPAAGQKVKFEFLNDYGAGVVGEGVLSK
ncbi:MULTISPECIES: molecular chaperone [unclassified Herbaspirillum]|uniref:fimbrial biogenesis chaperone n=1 Tax=unclassified Herbaspirillum TaxID=2624150 RepID=UPI00383AD964